jgi:hypothetical protein
MIVIDQQRTELLKTDTATTVVIVLFEFLLSNFLIIFFLNHIHVKKVVKNSLEKILNRLLIEFFLIGLKKVK